MGKSMSLYFTLFETSALFASTFIINFLILDGRSNYLEGALLCAGYAIVSLSAWYYPEGELQEVVSELAGQAPAMVGNVSSLVSGLPAGVMMVKEVVREGVTLWEKVG